VDRSNFSPADVDSIFVQNDISLKVHTALEPRRPTLASLSWEPHISYSYFIYWQNFWFLHDQNLNSPAALV
jgi:hypothetical protein